MKRPSVVRSLPVALVLSFATLSASHAEIERNSYPTNHGLEFLWWPKVTPPANWAHNREASFENHINLFVLKGEDFADSPAVMYARAIYFEKGNTEQELETAIREDHAGFLEHAPGSSVDEVAAVKTGDGTSLRTYSFTPKGNGHWELVAYGREPEFVLMFCISATSKAALEEHRAAFLAMVRSYTSRDKSVSDP